jgi:adenosylcobinamide-GDP ribazoletransferase
MKYLGLAFSLLTSIPVNLKEAPEAGDTGRAAGWYPWVGLIIGGLVVLVKVGADRIFPPSIGAALAVAVWVWLTGGLHLDGLADCCDGLLNASSRERRLEIMRDPRVGTFGALGLILDVLMKYAAILTIPLARAVFIIPLAAVMGRWLLVWAGKQPQARPGGMGADFSLGLSNRAFWQGALPVVCLATLSGWRGLAAFLLAHLAAIGIFRLAKKRLGGVSGDVFGLTVEATEIVVLLVGCYGI